LDSNIFTIHIDSYRTSARLGWSKEERTYPQMIMLNLILTMKVGDVAKTDHIHDTIDYDSILETIESHTSVGEWRLLEKMVYDLATLIIERFPNVQIATVSIKKNGIPHLPQISGITVEYQAVRDEE
jgi:7,8-dihydroneopterin aldolase/epimerase/oxygenase